MQVQVDRIKAIEQQSGLTKGKKPLEKYRSVVGKVSLFTAGLGVSYAFHLLEAQTKHWLVVVQFVNSHTSLRLFLVNSTNICRVVLLF